MITSFQNRYVRRAVSMAAAITLACLSAIIAPTQALADTHSKCSVDPSSSVKLCIVMYNTEAEHGYVTYSKLSEFQFSVTRLDSTQRLADLTIVSGSSSRCSAYPRWSGCTHWVPVIRTAHITTPRSGFRYGFAPFWAKKWGQVQGTQNYQSAYVQATFCRGTRCHTVRGPQVMVGSVW